MAIKLSGLNSGMDTESIIAELVKAKSAKKDELVGAQKKLSWKQDAWKGLNSKIYSFYSKTLSNMRFQSDYNKKTTTSSHSAVSVITGSDSPNCVQTMKINSMAKAGYLTGAQLSDESGTYTSASKLVDDLGITEGSSFTITANGTSKEIKITESTTIGNVLTAMREAGVNANFDETNQRFYISAKSTGKNNDFTITTGNVDGLKAMSGLGILSPLDDDKNTKQLYEDYSKALVYDSETGELDRDATAEKLKKFIDKAVAENIKTNDYAKTIEDAQKAIDAKQEELNKAKADFAEKFKVADGYLQAKDADGNPIMDEEGNPVAETDSAKIQAAMDALTKDAGGNTIAYEDLSEEDKKAYDNYNEQLSAAKNMDSMQEYIDSQQNLIDETLTFYTPGVDGGEGQATQKLIDAITNEQITKALEAAEMLKAYSDTKNPLNTNAIRIAGVDSEITLNGATYKSERNTFEINGLTISVNSYTSEEITLTTQEDTNGIYDMVKNFLKDYNELINEMDKLYNAKSASKYNMLTDEERESLSEKEAEEWDNKIKEALLRRDSTLGTVFDSLKTIMLSGVEMSDGTTLYLSEFGINTLGYFNAEEFEKNAYHIDGNPDDTDTANKTDKLKAAIASDPDKVAEFFANLSRTLYAKLDDLMERTDYSSAFTVYNDKSLKEEYDKYTEKISDQEEKIANFEDRYYDKFTAMEVALSKLSSQQSTIASLFG